jgi:hypothetical protein
MTRDNPKDIYHWGHNESLNDGGGEAQRRIGREVGRRRNTLEVEIHSTMAYER